MYKQIAKVKCYSGYSYPQQPKSFCWQDTEHEVSYVEKEWQEPGKKFFKVRTEDERLFELCYNQINDEWSVIELI